MSADNVSSPFAIAVDCCRADASVLIQVTTKPELQSGRSRVHTYQVVRHYPLTDDSHQSFLDLFEAVARDLGTRMPSSRCRAAAGASDPGYEVLLSRNLSPDILYGYGDPGVLRVTGRRSGEIVYYLVATSGDAPESIPILHSPDLRHWQLATFAFPRGRKPRWAMPTDEGGEYWAPDLVSAGDRNFVLCFAARGSDQAMAIGLARSETPTGPFVPTDEPLIAGGAIDPHIFIDDDGSAFLFWKKDSNDFWPSLLSDLLHRRPELAEPLFPDRESHQTACFSAALWPWVRTLRPMERFFAQQVLIEAVGNDFSRFQAALKTVIARSEPGMRGELDGLFGAMQTVICAQSLDLDRLTLVGEPSVVLRNDLAWEGPLVEGVWITKQKGSYYIFYSGNDFSTAQYGVGVGQAESPLGPYVKSDSPFLCSTADWWGPGHPTLTEGPEGVHWLLFHAYRSGQVGYKAFRALVGLPISFAEGKPAPR